MELLKLFETLTLKPKEKDTYSNFEEEFNLKYLHYFSNMAIQLGSKGEVMDIFSKEAEDRFNLLKSTKETFTIYLIDTVRNKKCLFALITHMDSPSYRRALLNVRLEGITYE